MQSKAALIFYSCLRTLCTHLEDRLSGSPVTAQWGAFGSLFLRQNILFVGLLFICVFARELWKSEAGRERLAPAHSAFLRAVVWIAREGDGDLFPEYLNVACADTRSQPAELEKPWSTQRMSVALAVTILSKGRTCENDCGQKKPPEESWKESALLQWLPSTLRSSLQVLSLGRSESFL